MGEGVFIGPESNGRLVLRVYVQYYYTAVQKLSRTSRYYLEDIPKSSVHPVLLGVLSCTIHIVRLYYLSTYVMWSPSVRPPESSVCLP
jgi:hypothetical protein